jgi:hypothetical protein
MPLPSGFAAVAQGLSAPDHFPRRRLDLAKSEFILACGVGKVTACS